MIMVAHPRSMKREGLRGRVALARTHRSPHRTGRQVEGVGDAGNEFVALYLFDSAGVLLEATIDDFGPRGGDGAAREAVYAERLANLGEVSFERVKVAPFCVERFGLRFGLIALPPEDEDDEWTVEMQPGNYMAFYEPWDSGDYDT
jgi:hypothetical protein